MCTSFRFLELAVLLDLGKVPDAGWITSGPSDGGHCRLISTAGIHQNTQNKNPKQNGEASTSTLDSQPQSMGNMSRFVDWRCYRRI